ncbi:hypothetical protein RFN29_06065 [Mesorhizobium sp. VK22B]|uniref:Transposase n=1 Tax=Mesorhizobium captivum TaxID=3072319 RepID=A0ABU4YZ58_9HYPH|nr:hypothetical protein [Mesorhizobium sp. VK22B]MDX8491139.1 hypothetical protein [Mesorhizobium sp. VK22B]
MPNAGPKCHGRTPVIVIFADGIKQDFIAFHCGRQVRLLPASKVLRLVIDQ